METKRLIFREWRDGDQILLNKFLQDAEVMSAYEHAFSDEEVTNWLAWNVKSYAENCFGLWALELKETGEIIGECGLIFPEIDGEFFPEISYHLAQEFWHQGYATEAALAVRDWTWLETNYTELIITTRDTNIASMNVAIRCGFIIKKRMVKLYRGIEMPHYLFGYKKTPHNRDASAL